MKKRGYTLIEVAIVVSILAILAILVHGVAARVSCKRGHEELTGGMDCYGTGNWSTCEPSKRFVCDDKEER